MIPALDVMTRGAVEELQRHGVGKSRAVRLVSRSLGIAESTVWRRVRRDIDRIMWTRAELTHG